MKVIASILFVLFAGVNIASAQSVADNEYKLKNYFWYSTNNSSALSFTQNDIDGQLALSYDFMDGSYHLQQQAKGHHDVSLHTDGSAKLGNFFLWGAFTFQNKFENGSKFNVINYEVEDDMPFFVADTMSSAWTKQAYLMSFKLASPILWEKVCFGLKLDYDTKVGAKQKDPRSTTYDRFVSVYPSVTVSLGKHLIGTYFEYTNEFERSEPGNENYRKSQVVYLSRGLGNGQVSKVGDNDGLNTFLINASSYGGGVQYGFKGATAEIFTEFSFLHEGKNTTQTPSLPKPMGRIKRNIINADINGAFGEKRNHLAGLGANMRLTKGIVPEVRLNTTAFQQNWDVIIENEMSNYSRMAAWASYEYQTTKLGHYDWSVGLNTRFSMRNDSYLSPTNSFNSTNIDINLFGGKQFIKKNHSFTISADAEYGLSLGSSFIYMGEAKTLPLARMYMLDSELLNSDNIKVGARFIYGFKGKALNYNFDISAAYIRAFALTPLDRIAAKLTASISF